MPSPFLRLRIGSRLGLAFATLLVLLLILAGLAVNRLGEFSRAFERLVGEQAEIQETVAEINDNAEDAARKLLVLISAEREQRQLAYTEVDAANRRLDAAMRLMEAHPATPARQQALQAVRDRLHSYRERYQQNIALIEAERSDAAHQMLNEHTGGELDLLIDAIRALSATEQTASLEQAQALRSRIRHDRGVVLLLCGVALAVGGLLAMAATRSIVSPLSSAESGARMIAAGQYQHRIPVIGQDEVSRVSEAMNTLAEAVGDREQQLLRMVNTDMLTGLSQRSRFTVDGDALLGELSFKGGLAVQLCMDVDRLKTVNSVLGFDAGDAVLLGAAKKLTGLFDGQACFGRLAGGTFVALVPLSHADEALQIASTVQEAVEHKLSWKGQTLDLSVSVGMALFPDHGETTEGLLRRAEQAMFEAKRQRLQTALYNPSLEAARQLHLSLLSDLQEAIVQGQLRQFLQPKISPHDGRLMGAEALVRWEHPERGWLPPGEFVPFAESTGRIRQVTQWMLERAVQTLKQWHSQGRELSIAVNVSTLDLQDDSLTPRIAALLAEAALPPHALQLELTETGLMASGPDPIRVLHSLHSLGVRLAIDDFGTGQSSLAYLQRLPVHELKIDRSFVDGVDKDQRRQELLASIVKLGHSLGLVVTAEGVENEAELAVLRRIDCDLVQGYLIAKPMDSAHFDRWRDKTTQSRPDGASQQAHFLASAA